MWVCCVGVLLTAIASLRMSRNLEFIQAFEAQVHVYFYLLILKNSKKEGNPTEKLKHIKENNLENYKCSLHFECDVPPC